MRVTEVLRTPMFERALREVDALVEPIDGEPLSAGVVAADGVLTVTVPFIYGISLRVGGHYVGSSTGSVSTCLAAILDAFDDDGELPRPRSFSSMSDTAYEPSAAPLAGWTLVAVIDQQRFDACLRRADRRVMDALDRRARTPTTQGTEPHEPHDETIEDVAAAALALPVEAWDMNDGTLVRLPGSFVFAAAMIGGFTGPLSLFEQGPFLCLSAGDVEFIAVTDAGTWRVPIT